MAFNPENKLTFEELAPSLQQLINSKAKKSDFDVTAALVTKVYNNLGTVRVTIGSGTGVVSGPQNGKELLLNHPLRINKAGRRFFPSLPSLPAYYENAQSPERACFLH